MSLLFDYAFDPTPFPIYASAKGANPNVIDLSVTISNSQRTSGVFTSILIAIPVGADDARSLSTGNLPQPTGITTGWNATAAAGIITITPGTAKQVGADPIQFVLSGIVVNTTPSADVPITITEFYPTGPKVTDGSTYSLEKENSNLLVASFTATPNTLHDLDQSITLNWACTDAGKKYSFRLRANDAANWQPRKCLADGNCYSPTDGINGVTATNISPAGSASTVTFSLDVVGTDPSGNRYVAQTVTATAQFTLPYVNEQTNVTQNASCRLVGLHWVASNADYCAVLEGKTTIVGEAPLDTYQTGYAILLSQGNHQLTVEAIARQSSAIGRRDLPPIVVNAPTQAALQMQAKGLALSVDGSLALIPVFSSRTVKLLQVASMQTADIAAPGPPWMNFVSACFVPGANQALFCDSSVSLIDLNAKQFIAGLNIPFGYSTSVCATPDGTLGFAICHDYNCVAVIEIANRSVEPTPISVPSPNRAAFTSDSKTMLVTCGNAGAPGNVAVIDVASRTVKATIPAGTHPLAITISPDNSTAYVANYDDGTLSVISLSSMQVTSTFSLGAGSFPHALAYVPTVNVLLVSKFGDNTIIMIDTAWQRPVPSATINCGTKPYDVAVSPDGTLALIATATGLMTVSL